MVESNISNSTNIDPKEIFLSNSLFNSAPRDTFTIQQIKLEGDLLQINITYGGGCENHTFSLIGSDEYAESYPVQTSVLLSHDANEDPCEALLHKTLNFNLFPLALRYQELYQVNSDMITLHIVGGSEGESVNYNFEITHNSSTDDQITSLEPWIFLISLIFLVTSKKRKGLKNSYQ
jgi:hypothetical protein